MTVFRFLLGRLTQATGRGASESIGVNPPHPQTRQTKCQPDTELALGTKVIGSSLPHRGQISEDYGIGDPWRVFTFVVVP
jgi:hypothetical protein